MVNRRRRTRTRVPKLKFTPVRNVGWHVSFRDPKTGHSHRHRFGIVEREREKEALALYHAWVSERLGGNADGKLATKIEPAPKRRPQAKVLKLFRIEAIRAGFKRAYDQRDYQMIVDVAGKIPESVLQEDEKLLMYFDVARTRLGTKDDDKLF